ncbi:MAG: SDR family NAD(P)-dependent oxidoreductase [Pseudonocardiales bacterium]|nr:SDR family NAD(P)-dependent oxidoreductase [Pseudonocardiales bacterium]
MTRASESVVVVTGASSGIARATALAFAERGASVVLAARTAESLRAAAQECERAGGRALAVPTEVTDEAAVEALARRAGEVFGRIDVWINTAAVIAYGVRAGSAASVPSRGFWSLGTRSSRVLQPVGARRDEFVAFSRHQASPNPGNLFEPMREWNKVDGGWRSAPVRVMVGAGAATAAIGTALTARRWTRH